MSELILRVAVDQDALQSIERLTAKLDSALRGLGPETTRSLGSFRSEVEKTTESVGRLHGRFSTFATEARRDSKALQAELSKQRLGIRNNIDAMVEMNATLRGQARNTLAYAQVENALNKEFMEQVRLKGLVQAETNTLLGSMRVETAMLAEQAHLKGVITKREYESIKAKTAAAKVEKSRVLAIQAEGAAVKQRLALLAETAALEQGLQEMRQKGVAAGLALRKAEAAGVVKTASAYRLLAQEQLVAIEMNRIYDQQKRTAIRREAEHAMGIHAATGAYSAQRPIIRGISGALGKLWLTYGELTKMVGGFATAMISLKGINLAADFEYSTTFMNTVAEITGDYSLSLGEVREKILGIKDSTHTITELANASKELVKAGFSSAEAVNEIKEMSMLAAVAEEDLSLITKTIAGQYRAWNEAVVGTERGVKNLNQTANMMGYTALKTAVDIGELATMMKHTSELAVTSGASFSELLAIIGQMSNMGIRGTNVTTALRTSILHLQDPTKGTIQFMSELGMKFSAFDEAGNKKGVFDLYRDFFNELQSLDAQTQVQVISRVFGLRDLKAASAMVGDLQKAAKAGRSEMGELEKSIRGAGKAGTFLSEVYDRLTETSRMQLKMLGADAQKALAKGFESPEFKDFIQNLRDIVNSGSLEGFAKGLNVFVSGPLTAVSNMMAELPGWMFATGGMGLLGGMLFGPKGAAIAATSTALSSWTSDMAKLAGMASGGVLDWGDVGATIGKDGRQKLIRHGEALMKGEAEAIKRHLEGLREKEGRYLDLSTTSMFTTYWDEELEKVQSEINRYQSLLRGHEAQKARLEKLSQEEEAQRKAGGLTEDSRKKTSLDDVHNIDIAFNRRAAAIARFERSQQAAYRREMDLLDAKNQAKLLSDEEYYQATRSIGLKELENKRQAMEDELTLLRDKHTRAQSIVSGGAEATKEQKVEVQRLKDNIADLETDISAITEEMRVFSEVTRYQAVGAAETFADRLNALGREARDLREDMQFSVDTSGLGESARVFEQQLFDLRKRKRDELRELSEDNSVSDENKSTRQAAIEAKYAGLTAAAKAAYAQQKELELDWRTGAEKGLNDYVENAGNAYRSMADLARDSMQSIEDSIVEAFKSGKLSMQDFTDTVIDGLIRIAVQQQIMQPFASALPGIGSSLFSLFGFADGGVMTPSGPLPLKKYATGGVASGPQVAVYGEGRQNEAYIPLPDNRTVPVTLTGGGSSQVTVNIIEDSSRAGQVTQGSGEGGSFTLDIFVEQIEGRMSQRVSQGKGLAPTFENRYGLNPAWGMVK